MALARDDPSQRRELSERYDRLSLRDAEARLAEAEVPRSAAEVLETDRLVQSLQALKDRSRKEEVLTPLEDRIDETLSRLRTRRAENALASARTEQDAGRPEMAIRLCERAVADGDAMRSEYAAPIREKARAEILRIVTRFRVVIEPVRGEFLQGPGAAQVHTASLEPGRCRGASPPPLRASSGKIAGLPPSGTKWRRSAW